MSRLFGKERKLEMLALFRNVFPADLAGRAPVQKKKGK
jgi:hypothetical protein